MEVERYSSELYLIIGQRGISCVCMKLSFSSKVYLLPFIMMIKFKKHTSPWRRFEKLNYSNLDSSVKALICDDLDIGFRIIAKS